MSSVSKSIKNNTIYNAIKTFSTIIFPLITFPYISRVLLVENIGKINFGLSFVSYFSLIASLGVGVYAIRECSKVRDDRIKLSELSSQIYSLNLSTMIFSYTLLFLFLVFYDKVKNYRTLIFIQSFSILFSVLGTDWINTAMEDFKYITIRTIVFQVISLTLMFIFVRRPEDYIKYAIISVVSSSGHCISNIFYRQRYCDISLVKNINFKKHFIPIMYLFVMLLAQTIFNNVDMSMLGIMKGDYSVGIYSTAHKICNVISQIVSSILWVVIPRISYYFSKNNFEEINKLLRKILGFNITLGLPCTVGVVLLSKDIIQLVAGKQFLPASGVLRILMIAFFISLFGGSFLGNIVLLSMNREKYYMIVCITCAFANAILNFNFIQRLDYIGAALTTVICSFLILVLLLLNVDKRIVIVNLWKLFLQPLFGCVFIIAVCICGSYIDELYFRMIFSVLFSVVGYFIIQIFLHNTLCMELLDVIKSRFRHV